MTGLLAAIGFALSLAAPPPDPPPPVPAVYFTGGSLVRRGCVHLGVRPAVDVTNDGPSWGLGATAQLSICTPW